MDIIDRINKAKVIWEVVRDLNATDLEKVLKSSANAYYNTNESLISDADYDVLLDRLKELDSNSAFLKNIGAPVKGKKVKLKYWMGSMNKLKTDAEIQKWCKTHSGPYVVMDKLDGISCLETGLLTGDVHLFTRGDGSFGQNISHLDGMVHMYNSEPKAVGKIDEVDVRGELIMSKEKFQSYAKIMANARNMVAGITVSKATSVNEEHAADVDFVVYEMLEPEKLTPEDQLKLAKKIGLQVVYYDIYEDIDINILDEILLKRKKKSIYEIDGVIVMQNKAHPRNQSGNPTYCFAYKGKSETAVTTVVKVEWNPSKDGYVIPIIFYEPVQLSGATLVKATGFNAKYIKENKIGPGAKVKIVRSGDTIPYVVDVVKPAEKAQMPKMDYTWDKNRVNIILSDIDDNHDVIVKRLTKFVTVIGVENMSSGIITKLVDAGYDTIPKIIKLKKSDLLKLEGFKETLADKLVTNLETSLDNLDILHLMVASNCFGHGFGKRKLVKILDVYPNIVKEYDVKKKKSWETKLLELDGFDTISVDKFLVMLPEFQSFYSIVNKIRPVKPYVSLKKESGKFEGEIIVFTGFRKKEWEDFIVEEGGQMRSKVSNTTTILVYNDGEETSSNYLAAKKLGIKLIPKSKFEKKIDV